MNNRELTRDSFFSASKGICVLHRKPCSSELANPQPAAPYLIESLSRSAYAHRFDNVTCNAKTDRLNGMLMGKVIHISPDSGETGFSFYPRDHVGSRCATTQHEDRGTQQSLFGETA
jgi:hypothetical protein